MRERVMKWLQIKRYNWKNYDIFLIAVVLILTFISYGYPSDYEDVPATVWN